MRVMDEEMRQATQGGRLLLVDDQQEHLNILASHIATWGYGYQVAKSFVEAVEWLKVEPFDLVITDIMMPDQDGMALLRHIKESYPNTGVMVVTGFSEEYSYEEAIKAGAIDFIAKPVRREELFVKLARAFRERQLIQAYKDELQTQTVLNGLLQLSLENCPFPELLQKFLALITSFPSLGLKQQGAVLLVDESAPGNLVLTAEHNLAKPLRKICARVPFGRCLCGRAAATREILFVSHVDDRHENRFDGMPEHGHYCVPIKAADGELLGVFTLYIPGHLARKPAVEEILLAVAAALAGIIKHQLMIKAVAENEARHQAITDAAMDGIVMMDPEGRVSFFNPAAERMFGYTSREAMGQDLHQLLAPPRYAPAYQAAMAHFFTTGQGNAIGRTIEVHGRHRDGREFPMELSLAAIRHKRRWQAVAIIRDISERQRHEAEKEKLNRELRQAYKMEAIGTLAGGIAHDFNNILTAILGFSEMAQEDIPATGQAHADLERVIGAANRARDLTRQILAFSRQTEQQQIPVKIQLILKEAVKLLRASIPSNISMRQEIDQECPSILADPTQLHQVIMNLCTNAYHAMREHGGTLTVGLHPVTVEPDAAAGTAGLKAGSYVLLTVSDTGTGINPEAMERIFEPFFTTKPQGEGTGMGLAIVHGIVAELQGVITVTSTLGRGTEFSVYFPVFTGFDAVQERPDPRYGVFGNERILLVDDESTLVEINLRTLSKFGYQVTARTSSIEALAAFRAMPDKFDLVITDQAMPNMTGVDLALEILKIREIPILLVTGFSDAATQKFATQVGIREVLVKPVEMAELTRVIRHHLRREDDDNAR